MTSLSSMSSRPRVSVRPSRAHFSPLGLRAMRPLAPRGPAAAREPATPFRLWSPTLLDRLQPTLSRIHE